MFNKLVRFSLLIIMVSFISCSPKANIEEEKEAIIALMDSVYKAHFNKDANAFYAPNAETWLDVRHGLITETHRKTQIENTQQYLDNMEFLELEPQQEPVVNISKDGTMASYVAAIHVKGRFQGQPVFWVISWQSVFEKINDEWKVISTANTEAPTEASSKIILRNVSKALGVLPEGSSLSAMANCVGPQGDLFQTLIFSEKTRGRMEQSNERGHYVLSYEDSLIWSYNFVSKNLNEDAGEMTKSFIQGHELHWLSLRPMDRTTRPLFKGFEEFKGTVSFKIESRDILDRPILFYYSFEDYLPLGFQMETAPGQPPVVVSFENWDSVGPYRVFKRAVFKQGDEVFQYEFTKINFNSMTEEDFHIKNANLVFSE